MTSRLGVARFSDGEEQIALCCSAGLQTGGERYHKMVIATHLPGGLSVEREVFARRW